MSLPIVLIHCQYVYGLGHLIRALQLAKGLVNNCEVYFLSGGEAVKGVSIDPMINFIQLDALYKEENCNKLSSVDENLTTDECLSNREKVIHDLIKNVRPEVILTEHFPFGFLFEQEVLRLISKAKSVNPTVKIVSSVRDIIEIEKGSKSDNKTVSILNQYYDLLLVHGDANVIPFETSFSLSNQVNIRQVITGYVIDSALNKQQKKKQTIIVSVAGGRVGRELKDAVVQAYNSVKNKINHELLVFDGAFSTGDDKWSSDKKIKYFKFDRSVFLQELSQSDISISLGGYNTTVESLYAANKVLIYNREFLGDNFEQEIRISSLEKLGLITRLDKDQLEPGKLADILLETISSQAGTFEINVNFDGVSTSVQEIKDLINFYD
jgi:predicted glycosyltransferase